MRSGLSSWAPDYNISPSKNMPILTSEEPGQWQFMKWGLNLTLNQQKRFVINITAQYQTT